MVFIVGFVIAEISVCKGEKDTIESILKGVEGGGKERQREREKKGEKDTFA